MTMIPCSFLSDSASCTSVDALASGSFNCFAAFSIVCVAGSTATQEFGTATEIPCVVPPIRLSPEGTAAAVVVATALTDGLADAAAPLDSVAIWDAGADAEDVWVA